MWDGKTAAIRAASPIHHPAPAIGFMRKSDVTTAVDEDVQVRTPGGPLPGILTIPDGAEGIVLFAHGSGSSRFSSRNRFVAEQLNEAGLATLLFDLLTAEENEIDERTRQLRFDIGLLTRRLTGAADWARKDGRTEELRIGLFGASTGAAAALRTAAERTYLVNAVVSRGGRPDLAGEALPRVDAPTLLIVGGDDEPVIRMNRDAADAMTAEHRIEIVPGATHLFEEPGTLERVADLARDWFETYLGSGG